MGSIISLQAGLWRWQEAFRAEALSGDKTSEKTVLRTISTGDLDLEHF